MTKSRNYNEPDWTYRSDVQFLTLYGWLCVAVLAFAFWAIDPLGLFTPGIDPDIGLRLLGIHFTN